MAVTNLFSGALVPLVLLPGWLQTVALVLPFAGMTSTPALIFIGQATGGDAVRLIVLQAFWVALLWWGSPTGLAHGGAAADRARGLSDWARMRRRLWTYRRGLGAHLRADMEYEADFWLLVLGAALTQVIGLVFLSAIFARVPHINGWSFPDVVLIFALVAIAEGVGSLFFEGTWHLAWRINQGELDYLLVRPYPVVLQVMSTDVGLNGLGNLLTGGVLLGWALARVGGGLVARPDRRCGGAVHQRDPHQGGHQPGHELRRRSG